MSIVITLFFSENVALKKPASQSGTLNYYAASRAVDGRTAGKISEGSCAHPYTGKFRLHVYQ